MQAPNALWRQFRDLYRTNTEADRAAEPKFTSSSWGGALIIMVALVGILWAIQIVNYYDDQQLNRFGLKPREVDGLWGVITQPFLHGDTRHMLNNTMPFVLIGWIVLLSGLRNFGIVTAGIVVLGGLATWLVAPSGVVVGASGLVFGWLGYLLARAFFARKFTWILVAIAVLFFFGTLLSGLVPDFNSHVSWQSHLCGFLAGVAVAGALHSQRIARRG